MPELNKRDGQPMPKYFTDLVAISRHGGLMGTPFKFAPAGQCGVEYSEIIPHTAATILHLLGLDHRRVSFHLRGRDERLTDVYDAKVLTPLLA